MNWIKKIFKQKSKASSDRKMGVNQLPILFDPNIFNSTDQKIVFDNISDKLYKCVEYENISEVTDQSIRTLCYIFGMHYQIENGGVMQFVDNESGNDFDETMKSLEEINASIQARILMDVQSIFPNNVVSKNWDKRRSQIDQINDNNVSHLPSFDAEEFWKLLDENYFTNYDSLYSAINIYVKDYMRPT